MRFLFVVAALSLMLTACSARADVGALATPQPMPTPQPAQPQVIVIQSPATPQPDPAQEPDAATVLLFALFVLAGFGVAGFAGFTIARLTRQSEPARPQPYSDGTLYRLDVTPEEYHAIQTWRERQRRIARDEAMRYIGEVRQ